MKATSTTASGKLRPTLIFSALAVIAASPVTAGNTDIANIPMANASTKSVLPNIFFVFDNSGSMDFNFMPDALREKDGNSYFYNPYCNTVYYDPAYTYAPPVGADGKAYPDSSWSSAKDDGYSSWGAGTWNLGTGSGIPELNPSRYSCSYSGAGTISRGTCLGDGSYTCTTQAEANTKWTADQKKNFANWYTYYRRRMSMAKAAVGFAVKDIRGTPVAASVDPNDDNYLHARIGYNDIYQFSPKLTLNAFDSAQKASFYSNLYNEQGQGWTPTRTALRSAGEMYASTSGPIQYSCQRNYTILMTDGYWNSASPNVGNWDSEKNRPQWDGTGGNGGSSNTMADVAFKYYNTNLRPDLTPNDPKTGQPKYGFREPPSSANLQLDDVARWPHMTTYTIGLGLDGICKYIPDYKTSTDPSGSFYKILNETGSGNPDTCEGMWPVPPWQGDSPEAIDDLWHAAVNGRGTYFSAKDPKMLARNLKEAMDDIAKDTGAGSADATGALNPTPGMDQGYTGSYVTGDWTGDVAAYAFDGSGGYSKTPAWSASAKLKARLVAGTSGRVIKTGRSSLVDFKAENLSTADLALFDNSKLSQYQDEWVQAQKDVATGATLIDFLRGSSTYERKSGATQQLYRARVGPLGDIVHSQPLYVAAPAFSFQDAGYATFKTTQKGRAGTVYAGANDGMLHAFDAKSGEERWAYVPPMVYPEMWRLADREYRNKHRFFVDGPLSLSDAPIAGKDSGWATVLVAAMGAGGRGYYALDITTPDSPTLLWTFSAEDNPNVGYTLGTPVIAKVDGVWAAIMTSGYNNVPEGDKYTKADGGGYVFVRNLKDGTEIATIPTGVGGAAAPSGLATLNVHLTSSGDATVLAAYGGDLTGKMYRFNLSKKTASTLIDVGPAKPITTAPEIGVISGNPVVAFGTGKYLGKSDLTTTDSQSLYAVKVDASTSGATETVHQVLESELVSQTLSDTKVTNNSVDWGTKYGWRVDLPHTGERVHIHPQYQLGVIAFATAIPPAKTDDPCNASGGTGYLYLLAFKNGGQVTKDQDAGTFLDSLPVGLTLTGTSNLPGTQTSDALVMARKSDGSVDTVKVPKVGQRSAAGQATRVQWRELLK